MKSFLRTTGFSRFESILGLTVLVLVVAIALPRAKAELGIEQGQRAGIEARNLAGTILDFHRQTGQWPQSHDGLADLAELTARESKGNRQPAQAGMLGTFAAGEPAWLKEIPMDPWGQPYLTIILDREAEAILVISTGRNGNLETARDQLTAIYKGGRMRSGPVMSGDDIGYLLQDTSQAGTP